MNHLVALFFCLGAFDFLIGGKLKLAKSFEKGFQSLPDLFITMTGFMALAPWISEVAAPVIGPLMRMVGADPSFFAGMCLSSDAGAAILAKSMADTPEAGLYNGLIVGSLLGCTISFTIPYAVLSSSNENRFAVIRGLMVGFVFIPVSCALSGIFAGIPFGVILANTIPAVGMALLLIVLFRFSPVRTAALFQTLCIVVRAISLFGASALVLKEFIGVEIVKGLTPASEIFPVIANIGFFLAGILPVVAVLQIVLDKPLRALGRLLKIDLQGVAGLMTTMVNSMPVIFNIRDYEPRSAMLNASFFVVAAFSIGDYLAFSMSFAPHAAIPLMLGKLIAGFLALAAAAVWGTGTASE